jgi:hypothetical protein
MCAVAMRSEGFYCSARLVLWISYMSGAECLGSIILSWWGCCSEHIVREAEVVVEGIG